MMTSTPFSRRRFLQTAALGAAITAAPRLAVAMAPRRRLGRLLDPGRKMNLACVGCGGKGHSDILAAAGENIVALCDVDAQQARQTFARYPSVPKYQDYRKMLRELDDQIDGVTISTPDHMHYPIGMLAISMGKHVFIQKPLTRLIGEARELTLAARQHRVVTQMGNQGHAGEGLRLAKEWVDAGLIGSVREVHVWTSKLEVGAYKTGLTSKPGPGAVPPPTLDWNLWVGTSPMSPYSPEFHPKKWRGWQDFGCGALGDIGCHTMDAAFYALDLRAPTTISAETAPFTTETFPAWSVITYEFPGFGNRGPVKMFWYDGGKRPSRPKELEAGRELSVQSGYLMIGDRGVIYDSSEKCSSPRLLPEARMREEKFPPKTLPRVPNGDPMTEWIAACKGGPRPGSNFDYAGPLSETVLLGNVALNARGATVRWDAAAMKVTSDPSLNRFLTQPSRAF